ncbi:MAG: hypothetical protein PHH85_01935 [Candidatus Methanoperedens sp.]|nr:hypothetical protein [Candidatus Methanoperedens sp.]
MSTSQNIPQVEKNPEKCDVCDATLALGLLTSACESQKNPALKGKCLELMKPLESGHKKAAEVLANVMVEMGEEDLNGVVDRFNLIMYDATARAKEILIQKGVLNKDGTPKEMVGDGL